MVVKITGLEEGEGDMVWMMNLGSGTEGDLIQGGGTGTGNLEENRAKEGMA